MAISNKDCYGKFYAVKEFEKKEIEESSLGVEDLINEIMIMYKSYQCENISHLKEIFEDDEKIYLVMDYQKGGDLMERLLQDDSFPLA